MNFKLDENLPLEVGGLLRLHGHDVHTVPDEFLGGKDDESIRAAASNEGRLLMTQDLDFSDVRKFKPGTHPGIVLVRLRDPSRRRLLARIGHEHASVDTWTGYFVVISDRKLRIRRPWA